MKKTEDNINRQFSMIESYMNQTDKDISRIESTMEVMMATTYFNSASLAAYLLMKSMRSMQEMLFDSLIDVYKGHMDVHILSPVDLVEQLNVISGKLPKALTLPIENIQDDIKDLYRLLYVKARVTPTYFLFEVHVPLTSDEDFQLYKAFPLPIKTHTGTTTIQLQSQYIAVNFPKSAYISMAEEDVKLCTQLKSDRFICYKNLLVFNLQNNNAPCEAKLLSHNPSTPCDVKKSSCDDAYLYTRVEKH
ncbi:baculovirus F protein domain-containing protein [Phthorimaea operculella]|nr:baculovirus F protein domain-containing protein [Phthorimaea operculella]